MRHRVWITAAACSLLAVGLSTAHADASGSEPVVSPGPAAAAIEIDMVGSLRPPTSGPHVGSHGSTVIVDAHGLLVAERNAGAVVRSDRDGNALASVPLHEGLGEIVHDGAGLVFVADRRDDRVVQLSPGDATGKGLAAARSLEIREPHGLALSPDGETLLVTSVADQRLLAVDTKSLAVKWQVELAAEPRGVAISADGRRAAVGFLSSGSVAIVDIESAGERVRWHSLEPRDHVHIEEEADEDFVSVTASLEEARSRFQVPSDTGRRQARNLYVLGFIGHGMLAAPHQLATSQMKRRPVEEMEDSYGGGAVSIPPLVHRIAVIDRPGTALARTELTEASVHQPRGLAYDLERDVLYVGGYGDDRLLAVFDVSSPLPYIRWATALGSPADACGIDGIAVEGSDIWVHCELARRVVRVDAAATPGSSALDPSAWKAGPELAKSLRSELVEHGAELFRRGRDSRLSDDGALACASCHPEGRADGLTWRLGKSILQTPILAGRVQGTAPYKWDGQDEDLDASLHHTIARLGGSPERLRRRDYQGLQAYILSMTPPRSPAPTDAAAVARGRELFVNDELACDACHAGDKLTDGAQYAVASTRFGDSDTPSLLGVAHSAPYYHDGSAPDLRTLLTDRANVHQMADMSSLTDAQVADLDAYLRTL